MENLPKITDAEWTVMDILWKKSPLSGKDVFEELKDKTDWKIKTLKTLLNRLVNKKAITFKQKSRVYLYSPLVSREDCIGFENKSFLHKFYQGSIKKMLTGFVENENLSSEDIEELQKIIDKHKGK